MQYIYYYRQWATWESLSERRTKRTIDRPKWDNRRTGWGSNRNNGDDNNGDAKCVRGPMGEFRRVVRYRKGTEIVETIDKGLGPRVQKRGLECRHVMRAG